MEKEKNAIEWYQMGVEHGRSQGPAEARWVREEEHGKEKFYCEHCKRHANYNPQTGWELTNYCPDCGFKMR